MKYHVIYTEDDRVQECEVLTDRGFEDAEQVFHALHPRATYWEVGVPLVEVR